MEHMFKKFLPIAALLSVGVALADCCNNNNSCDNDCIDRTQAMSCLLPRSQSKNNVIKTAGLDPYLEYLDDQDCFNWNLGFALEYTQSFNNRDIAECFFGPAIVANQTTNGTNNNNNNCGCDDVLIRIVGSNAADAVDLPTDLVAENFFLPEDFVSNVTFSPSIKNINFHIQFYAGFDEWAQGLYFRLYAPVTHTRWNLDAQETIIGTATEGFAAGEIAPEAVAASALQPSFLAYMAGNTITVSPDITVQGLRFGRIAPGCDTLTETKLADLRAEFGWNFLMCEDYHFGFYLETAAPTGNHCCADFLFSPIVGNGHFWELGAGLTAHYTLWRGCDDDRQFDFYIEADATHLFQHSELRTFDLVGKPLSRYMIAEQLTTTDVTNLTIETSPGVFDPASAQFSGVYAPVANITTQNVDVSIAVHGEVLAKFVYTCGGFSWELGYDFYGRSCEDVELNCDCPNTAFADNRWALRGDAQVFGFTAGTGDAVALGASRSDATIFSLSGGGPVNNAQQPNAENNDEINNPALANNADGIPLLAIDGDITAVINTSNPPVFITQANIDFNSSQSRFISNKVFTHFNYTWMECGDWMPFLGIGASAEFGSHGHNNDCCPTTNVNTVVPTTTVNNNCDNDCDSCGTCSISQWAVWIKGGVSFN